MGINSGQHRMHQRVRAEIEKVKKTDDIQIFRTDPQFLLCFPQGAVCGRFARFHSPAGKADLVRLTDPAGTYLIQQAQAVTGFYQRYQNGIFSATAQKAWLMLLIGFIKIVDVQNGFLLAKTFISCKQYTIYLRRFEEK